MANSIICDSDFDQDFGVDDADGVAQDITNWTFEALCKRDCKCLTLTSGSGIAIQDAANGVFRISMTAAQTKDFGPGDSRWLVWRTDSGLRKVIGEGSAIFEGKGYDS